MQRNLGRCCDSRDYASGRGWMKAILEYRPSGSSYPDSKLALGSNIWTSSAAFSNGDHCQSDRSEPGGPDCPGAGGRQVDYSTTDVGTAIVDADDDRAASLG